MKVRTVLDAVFALVGLALVVLLVRRELRPRGVQRTDAAALPQLVAPALLDSLEVVPTREASDGGVGSAVRLVVLFDAECPYCKRFHEAVRGAERKLGAALSVSYAHFPLSQHRFARPGAVALQCSAKQDRFDAMLDEVYEAQDSLGLLAWDALAARASVRSAADFATCTAELDLDSTFARNLAVGRAIGVKGTPAVILNGTLLSTPPDEPGLVAMIDSVRALRREPPSRE